MIDITFRNGGEPAEGIDYGLSEFDHKKRKRKIAPRLVCGDPEDVKAAVRTLKSRKRYTSGVLSFAEKNLPEEIKRAAIREHLLVCYPGLDPTRIANCYIEHRDEGFLELHYFHAGAELESGKKISGYVHRIDRTPRRLWSQSFNARHNLVDPDDPKRWRLTLEPRNHALNAGKSDALAHYETKRAQLLGGLVKLAVAGTVRCRGDIERALTQAGWTISRRTRRFLSVTSQSLKKPIRLAGKMFAEDWCGAVTADAIEDLSRQFHAQRASRLSLAIAALTPLLRARATYNGKRYGNPAPIEPFLTELATASEALRAAPVHVNAMADLLAGLALLKTQLGEGTIPLETLTAQARRDVRPRRKSRELIDDFTPTTNKELYL